MAIASATTRKAAAILALIAWTGLIVQFASVLPRSASLIDALWAMLRYFTVTTNLLMAVVMTGIALGRAGFWSQRLLGGLTLAMIFVGGVHVTLLRGRLQLGGSDAIADLFLHYLAPLAILAFWLLFRPRGDLRPRDPFLWSIYPLAYGAYAIARGVFDGRYPYPFLDVARIGAAQVAANVAMLILLFLLVGLLVVRLDRRAAPSSRHP